MREYALALLMLSHAYAVGQLKRLCEFWLERRLINSENVIDVFQLALLCDAPRLSIMCHHFIVSNIKAVSATDGWNDMKMSHPVLEKELLESLADEDAVSLFWWWDLLHIDNDYFNFDTPFPILVLTRNIWKLVQIRKQRIRKEKERKVYMQLYEAMEALVHICKDGCRTIGPHDKVPQEDQGPCQYAACKDLEALVRHFAGCKMRGPGGCIHCKRMWQILELHSRLCARSEDCKVPLCRYFSLDSLEVRIVFIRIDLYVTMYWYWNSGIAETLGRGEGNRARKKKLDGEF